MNPNTENFTLVICSYNTPTITLTCLKSFIQTNGEGPHKLLLYDNSTNEDTAKLLTENKIPFIRNPGGLHGPTVNRALKECTTPFALLVDTDIIFKDKIDFILDVLNTGITAVGNLSGPRGGKNIAPRLDPWFCGFNVKMINENSITYFKKLVLPSEIIIYDVGSSFIQDVKHKGFKIVSIRDLHRFFIHFEGMSWRTNRYSDTLPNGDLDIDKNACHSNKVLYDIGKNVEQKYMLENKNLIDEQLKQGCFI